MSFLLFLDKARAYFGRTYIWIVFYIPKIANLKFSKFRTDIAIIGLIKKFKVIPELTKPQMQIKNVLQNNYSTNVWFLSTVTNEK